MSCGALEGAELGGGHRTRLDLEEVGIEHAGWWAAGKTKIAPKRVFVKHESSTSSGLGARQKLFETFGRFQ